MPVSFQGADIMLIVGTDTYITIEDVGTYAAGNPFYQAFLALAQSVVTVVNRRNKEQEKTKIVKTK